jgi:hypothetical protein
MHITSVTKEEASYGLRAWFICQIIYIPVAILVRTSICIFEYRLLAQPRLRKIIQANLVCIWVMGVISFFIVLFQCNPPSYFWEYLYEGGSHSCQASYMVPNTILAHSVVSCVNDLILAILPITLLRKTQLPSRIKAAAAGLLGLGILYV